MSGERFRIRLRYMESTPSASLVAPVSGGQSERGVFVPVIVFVFRLRFRPRFRHRFRLSPRLRLALKNNCITV